MKVISNLDLTKVKEICIFDDVPLNINISGGSMIIDSNLNPRIIDNNFNELENKINKLEHEINILKQLIK